MPAFRNLTGQIFGRLTVVRRAENGKSNQVRWHCTCQCGTITIAHAQGLWRGTTFSCGCSRVHDLTGKKFHRYLVIERATSAGKGHVLWKCQCECGTVKVVKGTHLTTGETKSCGCYGKEENARRGITHGMSRRHSIGIAPEYYAWARMIQRTENPQATSFRDYGGRGITVCAEWRASFEAFYAYIGPRPSAQHSLDRINVNGNYQPGNVRWATAKEQANNRRPYQEWRKG